MSETGLRTTTVVQVGIVVKNTAAPARAGFGRRLQGFYRQAENRRDHLNRYPVVAGHQQVMMRG